MNTYYIWSEGYIATGEHGNAHLHGTSKGSSFKEACDNFAEKDSEFKKYYNPDRLTFWGCRLFDNHADAAVSFG